VREVLVSSALYLGELAAAALVARLTIIAFERAFRRRKAEERPVVPPDRAEAGLPPVLGTEPIVAWRTWLAELETGQLHPVAFSMIPDAWKPRQACIARCPAQHPGDRLCDRCGFHALKSEAAARARMPYRSDYVWGTVALWGHVIEGTKGYRAQCAYPIKIYAYSEDLRRKIANRYACETELAHTDDELLSDPRPRLRERLVLRAFIP
jgi:hypothetical protein